MTCRNCNEDAIDPEYIWDPIRKRFGKFRFGICPFCQIAWGKGAFWGGLFAGIATWIFHHL